ncbi:protein NDUFAF4 homolog [Aricia agestis]|uniref:protein NDUFAF4 homolog n=1 Tax=Aricia agestis TaxID=91739 RepID=UPI001C203DCD|nr:protein NDUFAF4 homolog [Aricia agestis]
MGALATKALRPVKTFNIENRAHKLISKEKPTPAPSYPSTLEELKRVREVDPNIDEKLDKKDPGLDLRLKNVYVTSFGRPEDDVTKEIKNKSTDRPLPQDRKLIDDFDFGLKEPDKIPHGRTTLRLVLEYLASHQVNPEEVTAAKIAFEYKMRENDVETILKYFKTYEIYVPPTKNTPAQFAGPSKVRKQLYDTTRKQLGDTDNSKENEKPTTKTTSTT